MRFTSFMRVKKEKNERTGTKSHTLKNFQI